MEQAFKLELTRYIPDLRAYARALTRDRADSEDLTQECLVRALRKHHLFEPGTDMRAWLRRIMRNLHLNAVTAGRSRAAEGLDGHDVAIPPHVLARLALRDVDRLLPLLGPDQRQALWMVVIDGIGHSDAARRLDIAPATMRSRLRRARRRLALLVAPDQGP